MADSSTAPDRGFLVAEQIALGGLPIDREGEEFTLFLEEAGAIPGESATVTDIDMSSFLGAWQSLDWQESVTMLDHIRHMTPPTNLEHE